MSSVILHGDSLEMLKDLPDASVDSVVTDPPYGLAFMGKKWDYDVPSVAIWTEVLRVLKPGGHLLSFGGTRTYHRMVVNIEDAGFEIRDQIMWIYGSGFPKSQDISKAIDKQAGAVREIVGSRPLTGNGKTMASGFHQPDGSGHGETVKQSVFNITAPATPEAKRFQGWGTALKPAIEPIVVARKPLEAKLTVAANVLKHGTGGLNIDASRVATDLEREPDTGSAYYAKRGIAYTTENSDGSGGQTSFSRPAHDRSLSAQGRWPANVLFDEEAAAVLDEQSGNSKSAGKYKDATLDKSIGNNSIFGIGDRRPTKYAGEQGGASRFFYVAKASKRERNAGDANNVHPTVKPVKLMEYLVKLVTPADGIVLDPFVGSGTTGVAAVRQGFTFIGIEREAEYVKIAEKRLEFAEQGADIDVSDETDEEEEAS